MKEIRIVVFSGGHGGPQILRALAALKDEPRLEIVSVVPSFDMGRSVRRLCEVSPTARGSFPDFMKCAAALSSNKHIRKVLNTHRFGATLNYHTIRNLLPLALDQVLGHELTFEVMCDILRCKGRVYPCTSEKTLLCGKTVNGRKIPDLSAWVEEVPENPIFDEVDHEIVDLILHPDVVAYPPVIEALNRAHVIVIAPGSPLTSTACSLLPIGTREAIVRSKAPLVYFLNLTTERGETDSFSARKFVEFMEKMSGRQCTHVVYNNKRIEGVDFPRPIREVILNPSDIDPGDEKRFIGAPLATRNGGRVLHSTRVVQKVFRDLFKKL